jgi:hypothetical protein
MEQFKLWLNSKVQANWHGKIDLKLVNWTFEVIFNNVTLFPSPPSLLSIPNKKGRHSLLGRVGRHLSQRVRLFATTASCCLSYF